MGIRFGLALAATLACINPLSADEPAGDQRAANLAEMKRITTSIRVFGTTDRNGPTVKLIDEPVLRYTDSTRNNSDAALWVWGDGTRPVAIAAIEFYPQRSRESRWLCEIASLSRERISVERGSDLNWTARSAGAKFTPLVTDLSMAEQPAARLTQMKGLQRRFTAHEQTPGEGRIELRPLARPLYRYQDAREGILDGVMMAFANGTNPEVLLMLEARSKSGTDGGWQFALIQMTGAVVTVELDGKGVWDAGEADPPAVRDSYVNGWLATDPMP